GAEGSWATASVWPMTPPSRITAPPPRAMRREEHDLLLITLSASLRREDDLSVVRKDQVILDQPVPRRGNGLYRRRDNGSAKRGSQAQIGLAHAVVGQEFTTRTVQLDATVFEHVAAMRNL